MLIFKKSIASLILITIFMMNLNAQNSSENFYSPENRLAFGNSLFVQQDYLRAIDEYLSFLRENNNDTIQFKIAYAYQQVGDYSVSNDYSKGLFFDSELKAYARQIYYQNLFFSESHEDFRDAVEEGRFMLPEISTPVNSLKNFTFLLDDARMPDSVQFIAPFEMKYREDVGKFYYDKMNPKNKNKTTAALLSALIPGLGKVYTENYTDGLTAFLVTGVFGFLAYDNFRADHQFRAWLFTGLATYFYAGNIYGSMAAADICNANIRIGFDNSVKLYLNKNGYFMPGYDFIK